MYPKKKLPKEKVVFSIIQTVVKMLWKPSVICSKQTQFCFCFAQNPDKQFYFLMEKKLSFWKYISPINESFSKTFVNIFLHKKLVEVFWKKKCIKIFTTSKWFVWPNDRTFLRILRKSETSVRNAFFPVLGKRSFLMQWLEFLKRGMACLCTESKDTVSNTYLILKEPHTLYAFLKITCTFRV